MVKMEQLVKFLTSQELRWMLRDASVPVEGVVTVRPKGGKPWDITIGSGVRLAKVGRGEIWMAMARRPKETTCLFLAGAVERNTSGGFILSETELVVCDLGFGAAIQERLKGLLVDPTEVVAELARFAYEQAHRYWDAAQSGYFNVGMGDSGEWKDQDVLERGAADKVMVARIATRALGRLCQITGCVSPYSS